jgi:bifunctional DNase/RNase
MVEMFVSRIALDVEAGHAVVVLADEPEERFLPIWIGIFEANAIAAELRGETPERPMTHDLLVAIIRELGYELEKVTITALRESTFFAVLSLMRQGALVEIDARPSDSLALALRCDARIFVAAEVLEQAEMRPTPPEEELDRFKRLLADVDLPSDLGDAGAAGGDEPPPPEEPPLPDETGAGL